MFVSIDFHHAPHHTIKVPADMTAGQVVEKCQRNLARLGKRTGCTWQVVDTNDIGRALAIRA